MQSFLTSLLCLMAWACFALSPVPSSSTGMAANTPGPDSFEVTIRNICCDDENDSSSPEDELYLLISAERASDGKKWNVRRMPAKDDPRSTTDPQGTHWVMEETKNDSRHCLVEKEALWNLLTFELPRGDKLTLYVTCMEQDGGTSKTALKDVPGLGEFLKGLPEVFKDDDDLLGTIKIVIRRQEDGKVVVDKGECTVSHGEMSAPPGTDGVRTDFEFRVRGIEKETNYVLFLRLKPV